MDSKRMFAQAAERLLATKTLEEITVADIVAESGLSRSNFYNHFTDKYDLVNWRHSVIHERRVREFLEGSIGYRAMLQTSLEGIGSYRTVYANSLGGDAYEALRSHISRISLEGSRSIFAAVGVDVDDPATAMLVEMFSVASCDAIFRWIEGKLPLDADGLAALIERALPAELAAALAHRSAGGARSSEARPDLDS